MAYLDPRRRKNGSTAYYVRWKDPSTGKSESQQFADRDDAKLLLNILKAHDGDTGKALASTRAFYAEVYTVTRMIETHLDLRTNVSGYTIRRYRGYLKNHINDTLGAMDARKVEYRNIIAWVKDMQAKGLEGKTIANVHGLISAAFKTMVREKKRTDNPCQGVPIPKNTATEESGTFLTIDEWRRLQGHLKGRYRDLFTFLAYTGLRFGEATALYGRDFHTDASGQAVVKISRAWTRDEDNNSYIGPPKTPQSRRSVAIDPDLYTLIYPLIVMSRKTGNNVFLNTAGCPIDHRRAWGVWNRAVAKAQAAGLEKRPRIHDLRHSNASWLLQAGLDIYKLQKHLGHRSIQTTIDRYSHLLPEAMADTAAAMGKAFAIIPEGG